MSDNNAPSGCPRCSGQLFEGFDREYECLQCGCVVYVLDPSPSPYLREPLSGYGNWAPMPLMAPPR